MKEEKQMSKNIADLYNEVMSQQAAEKTAAYVSAADGGAPFDRDFFEKVASGNEEAVGALNAFIDEARAEGHSDEDIESAIGEAMADAGISDEDESTQEDDFEAEKVAAYNDGAARALADVMGSNMAKTAGVTEQDLADYYLGVAHGMGYAETRAELESVVEKIASSKTAAKKMPPGLLSKLKAGVVGMRDDVQGSIASKMQTAMPKRYSGSTAANRKLIETRSRQLANLGMGAAAAGTAAGLAGAGAAGGYHMGRRKNGK